MTRQNVAIFGYGKMGKLVEQVLNERDYKVIAKVDPNENGCSTMENDSWLNASGGICFVDPSVAQDVIGRVIETGKDMVIGTTKFYINPDGSKKEDMLKSMHNIAQTCESRVIYASNFSVGVHTFWENIKKTAPLMAKRDYAPVIMEVHHTQKTKDVSGTAITTGNILLNAYEGKYDRLSFEIDKAIWPKEFDGTLLNCISDDSIKSKDADMIKKQVDDALSQGNIPIISVRYGTIPGTHRVIFMHGESVHKYEDVVKSRKLFAEGAVDALAWLQDKEPGLYSIEEMMRE